MKTIGTKEIAALLGISRKHVADRLTKRPDFPAPVIAVSRITMRWDEAEVLAWASPKPKPRR